MEESTMEPDFGSICSCSDGCVTEMCFTQVWGNFEMTLRHTRRRADLLVLLVYCKLLCSIALDPNVLLVIQDIFHGFYFFLVFPAIAY